MRGWAQDRDQWRFLVSSTMKIQIPYNTENFLISMATTTQNGVCSIQLIKCSHLLYRILWGLRAHVYVVTSKWEILLIPGCVASSSCLEYIQGLVNSPTASLITFKDLVSQRRRVYRITKVALDFIRWLITAKLRPSLTHHIQRWLFQFVGKQLLSRRVASSGMLRRVAVVRTDISEEPRASFIRVTRIGELGTTLAATSNRRNLRSVRRLLLQLELFLVHRFLSPWWRKS
jgi:hypothetical protein